MKRDKKAYEPIIITDFDSLAYANSSGRLVHLCRDREAQLADTWNYATAEEARKHLKAVMGWCILSRMEPFVKLARSLKAHMEGILGYFKNYTTSAAIEAINGLLQLAPGPPPRPGLP